jgi:hypothetical protein
MTAKPVWIGHQIWVSAHQHTNSRPHASITTRGLQKKPKKNKEKKQFTQKTTDRLPFFFSFFLGAPCVGCGPSVDMPPHVGIRSWLWGLPLRASSL